MSSIIDTAAAALEEIDRRGFPPVFRQIWQKSLPSEVAFLWHRPRTYFNICHSLADYVPSLTGLCPLWEENGDTITGVLPDGRFIQFCYEDGGADNPDKHVTILGWNYQQFITSELVSLAESDLMKLFDQVANLFAYEHSSELLAIIDAYTDETGDEELARFHISLGIGRT